jgi:multidrug efflux pump subunit AcrB
VVLIFGSMGHLGMLVDIGTMMTASVAMGVAVDDTIHFLTWFRDGVNAGMPRQQAIIEAYKRCAAAMSQTTLIGGFGLAVFAFSTFTPTQCFGMMMLTLLAAALIGDLIFLPALLASPLGRYFCPRSPGENGDASRNSPVDSSAAPQDEATGFAAPHLGEQEIEGRQERTVRQDQGHEPYKR